VGGACSADGREQDSVYITGKKVRGKRQPGRPRRRWLDNIKMDLV
jgi:hypothetical protein